MNLLKNATSTLSLVLLCSSGAYAESHATMGVSGQIIVGSCELNHDLTSGALDFGKIDASQIDRHATTQLEPKYFAVDVSCASGVKVGLALVDGQRESAAEGVGDPKMVFGLGLTSDNKKIGGYRVGYSQVTDDGRQLHVITPSFSQGWTFDSKTFFGHGKSIAFTPTRNYPLQPQHVRALNFTVGIFPLIAHDQGLDLAGDIALKGSATFQLFYN
jgi:type 1 fimbria pilin